MVGFWCCSKLPVPVTHGRRCSGRNRQHLRPRLGTCSALPVHRLPTTTVQASALSIHRINDIILKARYSTGYGGYVA